MNHRTRLGPLAIFLAVVVMVITTMAVLTIATSNADRTMAKRFASVTQTRYQLEADGERFISEAVTGQAGSYEFYEELNGYSITVEISEPDAAGNYELLTWKISKLWNADDPVKDIWNGL
jgi:hypothetical protein